MALKKTIRAALAAAFAMAAPGLSLGADLYGEDQLGDRPDYDRPYYSGQDRPSHQAYQDDEYSDDEAYDNGQYRRRSYKDSGYLEPMNRSPRYADQPWRGRQGCTPRWQIRQAILEDGWRDIRRLRVLPNVVVIRARRPDGQAFDLKLDRCTGAIVARRPSFIGRFYGERDGPRYSRAY